MVKALYKTIFWPIIFLASTGNAETVKDPTLKLDLVKVERIEAAAGVKSVILSPDGTKIYSQNLEDMSVCEFDRAERKLRKKLKFIPHAGKGFDYRKKVSINSYEEKPVEAHITHEGHFLWLSLHNSGGVVVWDLRDRETYVEGRPYKEVCISYYSNRNSLPKNISRTDKREKPLNEKKCRLLFIKTGTTPKVITSSPDGKYLFVANWHSDTVTAIKIDSVNPNDWVKITDLKTGKIPRGLAVSQDSRFLYVAQMGSNVISEVDLDDFRKVREIETGINPRHLAINGKFIYVSLNLSSKLVKINLSEGDHAMADTCMFPRTIALSSDKKIIFSVCYQGNYLQAFSADDLSLLGSWETSIHPVGVDVYPQRKLSEVWVGNYTSGTIKIFTFEVSLSGQGEHQTPISVASRKHQLISRKDLDKYYV